MPTPDPHPTDIQTIKAYHEATKHHYHKFANALGYLDWASQPDPFRRFIGADLIPLPQPRYDDTPLYQDLFVPQLIKPQLLNQNTVGKFLGYSLAVSAWKKMGDAQWALRMNPSSGNLHPTEGYLVLPSLEGLNSCPAVYHYSPREHGLEKRTEFSDDLWSQFPSGIFLAGLTSIYWREAWKYGERAFRYCQHDCGHAYMALDIAARILGWRIHLLAEVSDGQISRLLGLDQKDTFKLMEEERPELLAVIDCNPQPHPSPVIDRMDFFINGVAGGRWYGQGNGLSASHYDWEIIAQAHQATVKPETAPVSLSEEEALYVVEHVSGLTAGQVIKKRRSAVDMDGTTRISAKQFYQMLSRVSRAILGVPWTPQVHLCLFVHRVEGVPPGMYLLIRDRALLAALRAGMRPQFLWQTPDGCPESLPLFRLTDGDFIAVGKSVSCTQDIAGDGAFSLGMIAQFDQALHDNGAWFYKRLFWETGMIGQLLYLEAEAAGVSGTGIGCFFDDAVHDLLGLKDTAFQSLYHFTVGGAVIDSRLTTLPAYEG